MSGLQFSGDNAFDLRSLCSQFKIIQSVDSPTMRMEILIYDTADMARLLNGNEYVKLTIKTDSSGDEELEIIQKVFKIGEVTKSERAQTYILYTTSPSTALNETNRVFEAFVDKPGSASIEDIEKKYLKETKHKFWEPASGILKNLLDVTTAGEQELDKMMQKQQVQTIVLDAIEKPVIEKDGGEGQLVNLPGQENPVTPYIQSRFGYLAESNTSPSNFL